ncbi:MAG: hypothetical protein VYB60_05580 [SAR324 cluster bacterium]|nr:hypothetical protein [SAR324 cluster bacterium]
MEESALPRLSPTVCNGPLLSWRTRVIYWMMDSATPPCGCAQNDGIGRDV